MIYLGNEADFSKKIGQENPEGYLGYASANTQPSEEPVSWKVKDLLTFLEGIDPDTELLLEGRRIFDGDFYVSTLDDGKPYLQLY